MAEVLHLHDRHRELLLRLLREHLPGVDAWVYGSRVNGRSHDGSDLDLVLRGPGLQELPPGRLADFADAVRESNIPFLVEARDWARLPERFHREIEREHIWLNRKGCVHE
ncbi:MAG: nucleotidyltransferase domain-containing protein [Rhodobacter sp.]|nr:nucleotidyltransferase domain-containing protein [Rhodobacter sp.]MCY4168227.1 nucleotidyltransferase domain-containing protein [Rhodobacter sp.]MCY4241231.1 nucleotidyltransferase domain-containing protein [Rhodobacter sp.]